MKKIEEDMLLTILSKYDGNKSLSVSLQYDDFPEYMRLSVNETMDRLKSDGYIASKIVSLGGVSLYLTPDAIDYENNRENIKNIQQSIKMVKKGMVFTSAFIEKYTIIEQCGQGGNSIVYKAKDSEGNIYAIKLLNKEISSEKVKRFKNEMYFCMVNRHQNILKIIDNGMIEIDDKATMFYVMPYYSKSLKEIISNKYTKEKYLEFFNQILESLKYVHNKGMIHRDIKPENILFDEQNDICILADFGIAHFNEEDLYTIIETKSTSRMANFEYASPEQRKRGMEVNYKTDIYSLGLILNEMYTKQIPIGSNYKLISEVSKEYSFLDEIVSKMINQNSNNRYDSIEAIQYDIRSRIDIYNAEKQINELKNITISESEEKDILILEPPKVIDFKYDEDVLKIYLDKSVNQLWINSITDINRTSLMGYDINKFSFRDNVASISLPYYRIDSIQFIINYFKQWVIDVNKYYPQVVKGIREKAKREKEQALKEQIEREEKISNVLKNIKL